MGLGGQINAYVRPHFFILYKLKFRVRYRVGFFFLDFGVLIVVITDF
jgi:hypothetical protein